MGEASHEARQQEAVAAVVVAALRQQSRQSAHPSDQAALWHAAERIVRALEAEFRLTYRERDRASPQSERLPADREYYE